ncbi:MAG: carboxypeptidase M32 [Alphaproteobacteria bacterium]
MAQQNDVAYEALAARFKGIGVMSDVLGILEWDRATLMPHGSAGGRAEQMATLGVLRHEMLTGSDVADLLAAAADLVDPWQRANVARMAHMHGHAVAVPSDLVGAMTKAAAACEMRWRRAREENDFPGLLPSFREVLRLAREMAAVKSEALGLSPYDALLDSYEPGARSAQIAPIFADYAAFLPGFLEEVLARQAALAPPIAPKGPFAHGAQTDVAHRLMEVLGFDFDRGRLDVSAHPFCGGASDDIRITTRYSDEGFLPGLMGVVHETGHALYEAGLPADWRYQPVGAALGMAIHESQSLIVEMQACRSLEFVEFVAPILAQAFGEDEAWEPANLHRFYTWVKPDFIRVDADEVTYPAHVILRTRLEQALIGGDMDLGDLPAAWNEGMQELLGITPPTVGVGCLQDIHWPGGDWGYFPTYTLGAMTAAQLFAAAKAANRDLLPGIGRGDFAPLMAWLATNVHGHGSRMSADALLVKATGKSLDPAAFQGHLRNRYLS